MKRGSCAGRSSDRQSRYPGSNPASVALELGQFNLIYTLYVYLSDENLVSVPGKVKDHTGYKCVTCHGLPDSKGRL